MNSATNVLVLISLCFLAACTGATTASSTAAGVPEKAKSGVIFKTAKADLGGDADAIASDTRLSVPFFSVKFYKSSKDVAKSSTLFGGADDYVQARTDTKLAGVSDAAFQRITDQAYGDLIAQLQSAGIDLVPHATVQSATSYKSLDDARPITKSSASTHSPAGFRRTDMFSQVSAPAKIIADIEAGVLDVSYELNYVTAKKNAKALHVDMVSASVDVAQVAHAVGQIRTMPFADAKCNSFNGCHGKISTLRLQQPTYSSIPFGSFENTTSDVRAVAETAVNVLSMFSGGSMRNSEEFTLTADEKKFEQAALDALKQANAKLVQGIVAARQ